MRRVTYKNYAGLVVAGREPLDVPKGRHIERASWLTAQVESNGKFGTVISYDGTGLTAGIHQAIAVYPRELVLPDDGNALDDQGPLWKLLDRCLQALDQEPYAVEVKEAFYDVGWELAHGTLRSTDHGRAVNGREIRDQFTGSADGCMPARGKGRQRAEAWAKLFHHFFSEEFTFPIQVGWGEEKLVKCVERMKLRHSPAKKWRRWTPQEFFYEDLVASVVPSVDLAPEFDLAMCVWLSYTVNAPAIAIRVLAKLTTVFNNDSITAFSAALLRRLGTSSFGRWGADVKNGRYHRTRKHAMQLWPRELFVGRDAVMPAKF